MCNGREPGDARRGARAVAEVEHDHLVRAWPQVRGRDVQRVLWARCFPVPPEVVTIHLPRKHAQPKPLLYSHTAAAHGSSAVDAYYWPPEGCAIELPSVTLRPIVKLRAVDGAGDPAGGTVP